MPDDIAAARMAKSRHRDRHRDLRAVQEELVQGLIRTGVYKDTFEIKVDEVTGEEMLRRAS